MTRLSRLVLIWKKPVCPFFLIDALEFDCKAAIARLNQLQDAHDAKYIEMADVRHDLRVKSS